MNPHLPITGRNECFIWFRSDDGTKIGRFKPFTIQLKYTIKDFDIMKCPISFIQETPQRLYSYTIASEQEQFQPCSRILTDGFLLHQSHLYSPVINKTSFDQLKIYMWYVEKSYHDLFLFIFPSRLLLVLVDWII